MFADDRLHLNTVVLKQGHLCDLKPLEECNCTVRTGQVLAAYYTQLSLSLGDAAHSNDKL